MVYVPVRERIEREAKRRLEALENPPSVVERWDAAGNSQDHEAAIIYPSFEDVSPDATGADPTLQRTLELIIAVVLAQDPDSEKSTAELINTWIGRCEQALTDEDDPGWREGGDGEQLIVDAMYNGADEPVPTENRGELELHVRFQITYTTLRGKPEEGDAATPLEA